MAATKKPTLKQAEDISTKLEGVLADEVENIKEEITFFPKTTAKAKKITDDTLIRVKSNVFGRLGYTNARTGDTYQWNLCGEVQDLSLRDLKEMRSRGSAFFKNQWIVLLGLAEPTGTGEEISVAELYTALGIAKYYENLIEPSDYGEICSWKPEAIAGKVKFLSDNAKTSLAIGLREYVRRGVLDSRKQIKAFEAALGCELE